MSPIPPIPPLPDHKGITLDLSGITLAQFVAMLDTHVLNKDAVAAAVAKIETATAENLSASQKWTAILQIVDSVLTSAGVVLRVAALA